MKLLVLAAVAGAVACVVVFVAGVLSPSTSRRWQGGLARLLGRVEDKTDRSGGRVGDAARSSAEKVRRGIDRSAQAGRSVHDKTTGPDAG